MNSNVVKCPNNHYYDGSKFSSCPYCRPSENNSFTSPLIIGGSMVRCPNNHVYDSARFHICPYCMQPVSCDITVPAIVNNPNEQQNDDPNKTINYYSKGQGKCEPVVGWLICIEGPSYGKSYPIKVNRNFIGCSTTMDIVLDEDMSVLRERHAIVTYVPNKKTFLVQPGELKELFYLNDNVVLNNEVLRAYDKLLIGKTKLMFVPLCGEKFSWEDLDEE